MKSYLVYSTVALKWNRKIQCGNSCRQISLPLCLVWEHWNTVPTPLLAIHPCLPATTFRQLFSSARNQVLFYRPTVCCHWYFFSNYSISKIALPRYTVVAFRTTNWMDEQNLVIDSLQTSRFQTLSDHFRCPYDAINTFQGKVPA